MKKRKVVAVLVAAAMTVTSFLPGSGSLQTVSATENENGNTVAISDLKLQSPTEDVYVSMENDEGGKTENFVVSSSGIVASDLAKGLEKHLEVVLTTGADVVDITTKGSIDNESNVTVPVKFTPKKPGTVILAITSDGGVKSTERHTVKVKTTNVGVNAGEITRNGNTLSVSPTYYYAVDQKDIGADLVSGSSLDTLKYTWYKATTSAALDWTQVSQGTGSSYASVSLSRETGMYYKVVITDSNLTLKNIKSDSNIAISSEAYDYSSSAANSSNNKVNTNTTTTTDPNTGTTTTTTTTTDPTTGATTTTTTTTTADGTQETTAVTEAADGTKTTTVTEEKPDGSKVETTTVEATDGTKTTTIKEENADGSTKESTEVVNPDGSSTFESKEVKADGTVITVESATTAAGDTKSTEVTTYPAGSSVKVKTVESNVKANGNSVVVTTKENADNTVEIVSDTKNSAGETSVTFEAAAGKSVVTVSEIDTTAKSVTIPNKVTAAGKTYKVTKVGKAAMKGNKTATKITLGKNIKSVAAQAFQGTSKAKNFQIKGNVTTIGKNSFKNINKKATIKITATKKQYKAMVKKIKNAGGAPAKVTFKRVK